MRYLGRPPWDTGVSPPELVRYLETANPSRALDLGCGTGTNLLTLADYGWEPVGVDLAWLSVWRARLKLKMAGVQAEVMQGDVAANPAIKIKWNFHLVLDIGCYHSLGHTERADYRVNLQRWLVPGGTFLMYAHLRKEAEDHHGIDVHDLDALGAFLQLQWGKDNDELRPGGGGDFPATWVQFTG